MPYLIYLFILNYNINLVFIFYFNFFFKIIYCNAVVRNFYLILEQFIYFTIAVYT